MPARADARGFTLLETLAVVTVVAVAAGLVVARLPHSSALRLHRAGVGLATRLSEARERAIVGGAAVRVDVAAGLPEGIRLDALEVGGTRGGRSLELRPEGDALPVRAVLGDGSGTRVAVLLPSGFQPAHLAEVP